MTAISIFSEMLYKYIKEEAHIGYSKHYVYLGAKLEDLTTTPWFLFWTLSLVWLLVVALSFYWAIRRRWEKIVKLVIVKQEFSRWYWQRYSLSKLLYIHIFVGAQAHLCVVVLLCVCVCVWVRICVHGYMRGCLLACLHACVCVCLCAWLRACICFCMNPCVHAFVRACEWVRKWALACVYACYRKPPTFNFSGKTLEFWMLPK